MPALSAARPGRPLLLLLLLAATGAAEEPGPPVRGAPELDAGATARFTEEDLAFLDRLLAKEVRSGDLETAGKLRRLRDLSRAAQKSTGAVDESADALAARLRVLLDREASQGGGRAAQEGLALFDLSRDAPDEALRAFERIGPASPEDLGHSLLLSYLRFRLGEPAKVVELLERIKPQLAVRVPLRVSSPVFCRKIDAYRLYSPRPEAPFETGEDALLYLEIHGASFRSDGADSATCDLAFGLALKDDLQKEVWREADYGGWVQTYRGPLSDLHVSILLRLPAELKPGRHHLFVTCRDNLAAGRQSGCEIALDVAAGRASRLAPTEVPAAKPPAAPAAVDGVKRESAEEERKRKSLELMQDLLKRETRMLE